MRGHLTSVQRDQIEVSAEASDGNACAFASVTINSNTCYTLQRFCEVCIWEVANILGCDGVHHPGRVTLGVHCPL